MYIKCFPFRIMAGAIELIELLLLFKVPWFAFVSVYVCDSIFDRTYFIIGLCAVHVNK
jgi:hypothetical protein